MSDFSNIDPRARRRFVTEEALVRIDMSGTAARRAL